MNLQEEISEQRKLGFRNHEIYKNLLHKGFHADDINAAFGNKSSEKPDEAPSDSVPFFKKLVPLIVLIFIILLFFKFLPDTLIENYDIFLGLAGSILAGIFIFKSIASLAPRFLADSPVVVLVTAIATVILFGVLFISQSVNTSISELKKYGVLTTATVIDGSESRLRRSKTASITVQFISDKKETITTDIDITPGQLDQYYLNQRIRILYSSKNPQIARHIRNVQDLEYYK